MSKDYFGDLYNIFNEVIKFKNENMNDINIFNGVHDDLTYLVLVYYVLA